MIGNPGMLEHDWFPEPLPGSVSLGERSWCYSSFSCVHFRSQKPRAISIGKDSGVYHGTFFDLGPDGEVEIGDYCTIVGAIISTNSRVVIGDYSFVAHEVVIADREAAVPWDCPKSMNHTTKQKNSSVIILGKNCWIGARAVLLSGAQVGEGSIVGAGAVVDFPIPSFVVVAGNPARIVGSI